MEDTCCKNDVRENRGFLSGLFYGIIPHSFCIGFVVFSAIGAISAATVLKNVMTIPYFVHLLVLISFLMATISAIFYLKKNCCLNRGGIKKKWRYLVILYSVTVFTNIFMFSFVLPALANINQKNYDFLEQNLSSLSLKVDIPCTGHAPIITDELKKDGGVKSVIFQAPNIFKIKYSQKETSPQKISSMEIFQTYQLEKN